MQTPTPGNAPSIPADPQASSSSFSSPSTPTDAASPAQTRHRRTGKIACLPKRLRDLLNRRLRDGVRYADISRELARLGHEINDDNLSRWHSGGYQEWLKEQTCLEEVRAKLHFATRVLETDATGSITEASLRIAVTRMYCLITAFDPSVLTDKLAASPATYARLLDVLVKLTGGALKFERHRESQRQRLPPQPPLLPSNPASNRPNPR